MREEPEQERGVGELAVAAVARARADGVAQLLAQLAQRALVRVRVRVRVRARVRVRVRARVRVRVRGLHLVLV